MPADRDMNIYDTASAWAERLLAERALDAAAEAELEAWLQADPQHWQAMSARWQADLTARIEQLTQLRDQLTLCIGCGCLSLQHCPLRNPDDQLAALGAGAHFYQAAE